MRDEAKLTDADFDAVLAEAIAETGVRRYEFLCSDANTLESPNAPADWRRFIRDRRWTRTPAPGGPPPLRVDYGTASPGPCGGCGGKP